MGVAPRFGVELNARLKPEGSGVQFKIAAFLRPLAVLSVMFLAVTLAESNWERLKSAPFFVIFGTAACVFLLVALWLACAIWWFFFGNGQPMKFVKELLPAGGEELRVFLVFVLLALPVMTLLNRSLKRGRVSHRAAITFVILLFLLDAFLFYHGGKEGAMTLYRSFSAFFRTF